MKKNALKDIVRQALQEINLEDQKSKMKGKRKCCRRSDGSIVSATTTGAGINVCPKSTIEVPCKDHVPVGPTISEEKKGCGCGKACSGLTSAIDCRKCCANIRPSKNEGKKACSCRNGVCKTASGDLCPSHECGGACKGSDNTVAKKALSQNEQKLKEAEITAGESQTQFKLKVDVSNKQSETKLGIRIQLTPKEGMLEQDVRDKLEATIMKKLNTSLGQYDIQVSTDTDVPDPTVIGFFIPLSQIKNMVVKSIKGGSTPSPTGGAPTPPTSPTKPITPTPPTKPETTNEMIENMINEALLEEMRVRDLKEISGVVLKEDFYAFINAGNNVLRTLEEKGIDRGKKYLEYLVKHNIM